MAYVYRHIRLDKNEPFYIGIGSDNKGRYLRADIYHYRRSEFWRNIVAKTGYEVEILLDNISWEEANKKEIEFISLYGRINLGTGCLVNLTNGGGGLSGAIHTPEWREKNRKAQLGHKRSVGRICTDETRLKMSLSRIGVKRTCTWNLTDEVKLKMSEKRKGEGNSFYGKKHSEKTKSWISESKLGKKASLETKKKLSEQRSGEKNHMFGKKTSESTKAKQRAVKLGKKTSEETKQKQRLASTGKKHSQESIERMRVIAKERWVNRRNKII